MMKSNIDIPGFDEGEECANTECAKDQVIVVASGPSQQDEMPNEDWGSSSDEDLEVATINVKIFSALKYYSRSIMFQLTTTIVQARVTRTRPSFEHRCDSLLNILNDLTGQSLIYSIPPLLPE